MTRAPLAIEDKLFLADPESEAPCNGPSSAVAVEVATSHRDKKTVKRAMHRLLLPRSVLASSLVGVASLTSCQSALHYAPPVTHAPIVEYRSAHGFDRTWEAIIKQFAERHLPIRTIEKASGIIVSEGPIPALSSDDYFDLGSLGKDGVGVSEWIRRNSSRVVVSSMTMGYNVFVENPAQDESLVRVNAECYGTASIQRDSWRDIVEIRGVSTGLFEELLLRSIAAELGDPASSVTVIRPREDLDPANVIATRRADEAKRKKNRDGHPMTRN